MVSHMVEMYERNDGLFGGESVYAIWLHNIFKNVVSNV